LKTPNTFTLNPDLTPLENFRAGQLLLIDKPLTWTSFQVVNKIRYIIKHNLGIKKIKVGHAGTLDPLATGLLVICIGKKTKEIAGFTGQNKTYTGTFSIGATRPSFDKETEIDNTFPTEHINKELIKETAKGFLGIQEQMPPIFSAKKVDGVRSYLNARAGKESKLKTNSIEIFRFDITDVRNNKLNGFEVDFLIEASKGTYIRSIASDFGKRLNSGAYLSALRRTQSGDFSIENAFTIEAFEKWMIKYTENSDDN
jgi:tRNA pseudouridine55 synthase